MTVVDLHPEDLLDKDARGDLTDGERTRLDAHLTRCAACRAERVLRLDFMAELEGDDRPSSILGLVQGALKAEAAAKAEAEARAEAKVKADADAKVKVKADTDAKADLEVLAIAGLRKRTRRATVVLLCAAALLAAGAAGAAGLTGQVWARLRAPGLDMTHLEPAIVVPTATTSSNGPQGGSPAAARAASDALMTSASAELNAVPAIAIETPTAVVATARPEPSLVRTVSFTPSSSGPGSTSSPSLAVSGTSASAMFDAANAARRAGDTAAAVALYDGLERQYPASREARSANATTGRLLLDKGDAGGAVRRFDAYLASGATELREESMAGRATALERLGRDEDESRAWALLLATYPRTPYAAHARARVGRSFPQ